MLKIPFFIFLFFYFSLFSKSLEKTNLLEEPTFLSNLPPDETTKKKRNQNLIIPFESLDNLSKGDFYIINDLNVESKEQWSVNFKEVVINMVKQTNQGVLKSLADSLNLLYSNDTDLLALQSEILNHLETFDSPKKKEIPKKKLFPNISNSGIILKNADILESYAEQTKNSEEQIVKLFGNIEIFYQDITIYANQAILNTSSKQIFFQDQVSLHAGQMDAEADNLILDIEKKTGFALKIKGNVDSNYYTGDLLKINSDTHITIEKAAITFTSNEHPEYIIRADSFDYFGSQSMILENIIMYIHNQPFFYFPFFMQDPFGTGVELYFGNTRREGYYLLMSLSLKIPLLNQLDLEFNTYEKIGTYFRIKNSNDFSWNYYELDLAFSRYLFNENIPSDTLLRYTFHTTDRLDQDVRYRYKVNYNHKLSLHDPDQSLLKNTVYWNINYSSDPFFTSDLERNLPKLDLFDLIGSSTQEGLYINNPYNRRRYLVDYHIGIKQFGFQLRSQWEYANRENKSVLDKTSYESWDNALDYVVLPYIKFTYQDTIDPVPSNDEKKRDFGYLNLNYNLSVGVSIRESYERVAPYNFERNENDLNFLGSLSRRWLWNTQGKAFTIFDFQYFPTFQFNYKKKWGGEELGEVYINQNKDNTYYQVAFNQGASFNFPATKIKEKWHNSYDIDSMFPTLNLKFNYRIKRRSVLKNKEILDFNFDEFTDHNFGASSTVIWPWYGLFLIPYLDGSHIGKVAFNYNLIPDFGDLTASDFFNESRFININGSWAYRGTYRNFLAYSSELLVDFYDEKESKVYTQVTQNSFSTTFKFENFFKKTKDLLRLDQLHATYTWNYYFESINYLLDTMTFQWLLRFNVIKYWQFDVAFNSLNNQAFLYFEEKANQFGVNQINFFQDIAASLGFLGSNQLKNSLFKIQRFNFSLVHDLESWYVRLDYSVYPVVLPTQSGALKGFYFDQKISFEINLKPEHSPNKQNPQLFSPWNTDIRPSVFENF